MPSTAAVCEAGACRTADFSRLEHVLRRQGRAGDVPLYDLFSNLHVPVLKAAGMDPGAPPAVPAARFRWQMELKIRYMTLLGYDYVDVWDSEIGFCYKGPPRQKAVTTEGERGYVTAAERSISSRADFERYPWPDAGAANYARLAEIAAWLPPGMKVIVSSRGVLETTMDLLGHQDICYLLYDDPQLVRDVFQRVGAAFLEFHRRAAAYACVGAVTYCDDMGFKTQTLLSPQTYRELLFPWHRRIVSAVQAHGRPAILHACGNLRAVMPDIIGCGWDAKQSFEDNIEPVWDAQKAYGDRIALLGGFDVDKLSRLTVPEVRAHTRWLIEKCSDGSWALGTGNSVPTYIPVENFLAMIRESQRRLT